METSSTSQEAQSTREKLIDIIKKYIPADVSPDSITDSSDFIKDLKVNSTRFVDIILDIEDKFNVTIDDKTADNMLTIGDAVNAITQQQST